jgi:hypothetical protein
MSDLMDNELVSEIRNPVEIINNKTGEISLMTSYNKLNSFNRKLLDNRFSAVLLSQNTHNGIFLTLTTNPLDNLDLEIEVLKSMSDKIKKLLKKYNIKYIESYEFTEKEVPHIHLLILDSSVKSELEILLSSYEKLYHLSETNSEEENIMVAYYITKNCEYPNKPLLKGFDERLIYNKTKIYNSSKNDYFFKKQRSILYSSYLISKSYIDYKSEYDSENFIFFCLTNVKHPKRSHNTHLNTHTPHFIINDDKVYHSTQLRVFSEYSRVDKEEKRSIKKTHSKIIEYSKLILNFIYKMIIIPKNIIHYITMYLVNLYKLEIIIIKPPP